ncbi:MAG TPA: hypothetical protein VGG06_24250 [Thermoanaerobaculia bacterium]
MEQRPGVFAFFHLSLMEYLAARGWDAEGNLEKDLPERIDVSIWREVCLLAVGSRATDKAFLDRLYETLGEKPGGWMFLLHGLREEAAFDDEQRQAIVRAAGARLLGGVPWLWEADQRALNDLMRFSLRHAEWTRSWVANELATARGEALRAIVALRFNDKATLVAVKQRQDARRVAPDLLEYWPGSDAGRWASAEAEARDAFVWARESPGELAAVRSLAALRDGEKLSPGFVAGVLRWTASTAALARSNADRLADVERPGGRGLPAGIRVEPGSLALRVGIVSAPRRGAGALAAALAVAPVLPAPRPRGRRPPPRARRGRRRRAEGRGAAVGGRGAQEAHRPRGVTRRSVEPAGSAGVSPAPFTELVVIGGCGNCGEPIMTAW